MGVMRYGGSRRKRYSKRERQRGRKNRCPKGLYGERTYDVANVFYNPVDTPSLVANESRILSTAEILAKELDLDFKRLLAFAFVHGCLSASWSIEDDQDPSFALSVAQILEPRVG